MKATRMLSKKSSRFHEFVRILCVGAAYQCFNGALLNEGPPFFQYWRFSWFDPVDNGLTHALVSKWICSRNQKKEGVCDGMLKDMGIIISSCEYCSYAGCFAIVGVEPISFE